MPIDPDYVTVAERINIFYQRWPEGRLVTKSISFVQWPKDGILAVAHAYRTPDDPMPAVGTAMEPMPGPTNFTRDSEVQNAETSAWGRAIIALGIGSKVIASSEEVQARNGERLPDQPENPAIVKASAAQKRKITVCRSELAALRPGHPLLGRKILTLDEASAYIDDLVFAINEAKESADPDAGPELPADPAPTLDAALAGVPTEQIPF